MIISFEGGEGVGKTTQIRLLSSYLEKEHIPWVSIREPGGSPISERIRSLFLENNLDPWAELLLVLASRRVNIKKVIEPALSEGNIVIIDRFLDSTLVYQGILGDIDTSAIMDVMKLTHTLLEPDVTILLDAPVEVGLSRIRAKDRFENLPLKYHEKIRNAFLDICSQERHYVVDASRPIEDVWEDVISILEPFLARTTNS